MQSTHPAALALQFAWGAIRALGTFLFVVLWVLGVVLSILVALIE